MKAVQGRSANSFWIKRKERRKKREQLLQMASGQDHAQWRLIDTNSMLQRENNASSFNYSLFFKSANWLWYPKTASTTSAQFFPRKQNHVLCPPYHWAIVSLHLSPQLCYEWGFWPTVQTAAGSNVPVHVFCFLYVHCCCVLSMKGKKKKERNACYPSSWACTDWEFKAWQWQMWWISPNEESHSQTACSERMVRKNVT